MIDLPTGAEGCLASSFYRVSWFAKAGLSSEQIILTAALMLPSSIFAEILAAREEVASDLREESDRSAHEGEELLIAVPLVELCRTSSARFLMIDVRLCLFPPLEGLKSVLEPKLKRLDQAVRSSADRVTFSNKLERAEQQAGLADLGMCLMIGWLTDG